MAKSPFPGMDPYLEPHWLDIHTKLVAYAADALNVSLPEDLIARSEERVGVESDGERHDISPDVRVVDMTGVSGTENHSQATGLALAPYRLVAISEAATERFIEILDSTGQRLITVIEFVSPSNKQGKGLKAFVEKRDELLAGGVNFVEIDLNRAGDWRGLLHPHACPPALQSPYRATLRVPNDPVAVYLQPISLREPLPTIKIPLRPNEKPAELALQPLLEQAYQNGRYGRTIDYRQPLGLPFEGADAEWAREVIARMR